MRENMGLYRGKRKDNGAWVEGYLIWYEDGRARIVPRHTDIFCYSNNEDIIQTTAYEVIPETVGRYTGLPDKNGKKIFEGDIVRTSSIEVYEIKYGEFFPSGYAKEKFHKYKTYGFYAESEHIDCVLPADTKYVEVIGNIYEH